MSGFNWTRVDKENNLKMRKMDWYSKNKRDGKLSAFDRENFKEKMDSALAEYGWQKCPRCGGGRHPMFKLCGKCRNSNGVEQCEMSSQPTAPLSKRGRNKQFPVPVSAR